MEDPYKQTKGLKSQGQHVSKLSGSYIVGYNIKGLEQNIFFSAGYLCHHRGILRTATAHYPLTVLGGDMSQTGTWSWQGSAGKHPGICCRSQPLRSSKYAKWNWPSQNRWRALEKATA